MRAAVMIVVVPGIGGVFGIAMSLRLEDGWVVPHKDAQIFLSGEGVRSKF